MQHIPDIVRELISNGGFPTKHLSYSSLKEYLGNPRSFLKKYIRYEFDDQTKAVLMVGKAVHKALEVYFEKYKAGKIMPINDAHFLNPNEEGILVPTVHLVGIDHFRRELLITRIKGLQKWIKWNGGSFDFPIFHKDLTNEEIAEFYEKARIQARENVAIPENSPEGYLEDFLTQNVEYSLITLGSKQTLEEMISDSETQIKTAINNFFDSEWEPEWEVHSTERESTVFFTDEYGEEMPVPVKAIIDRLDIVENKSPTWTKIEKYCIITDYKTSDKFSLSDADKADYEMQAGTNYVTALVETGVTPKKMRFVEISKKAPGYILPEDPEKTLLKADLVDLIKTRLPDYEMTGKELVADMRKILIDAGILVKESGVNVFEIDFDERPDIMQTFFAMYKGVVTMIALSEMFGVYLPNITDQWWGLEAWQDFKEFEGSPRDKTPKIQTLEAPKVEEKVVDDLSDVESL